MTPVYTCPTNTRSRNVPPTSFKEVVLSAWQISDFLNCLNYISRKLSVSMVPGDFYRYKSKLSFTCTTQTHTQTQAIFTRAMQTRQTT